MDTTRTRSAATTQAASAIAVAFVLASAPAALAAQQPLDPVEVRAASSLASAAYADSLAANAEKLYTEPKRWRSAATLHRRAATLRGHHPQAVVDWRMAAWLYSASRDLGAARAMMERAGDCARAVGDIDAAANAYVDAALFALTEGREDRIAGLVQKARTLADAPLLPRDRRSAILERIDGAPRLAAIARLN